MLKLRQFLIGFGRWPAPNGVNLCLSGELAGLRLRTDLWASGHRFSAWVRPVGVSPLTWTARCAWILYWESNWQDYFLSGQFHWTPRSKLGLRAPNDGWTIANRALVIQAVREDEWEYLPTWSNDHSLGPSPGMAPEKTQESCRDICYMSVG